MGFQQVTVLQVPQYDNCTTVESCIVPSGFVSFGTWHAPSNVLTHFSFICNAQIIVNCIEIISQKECSISLLHSWQ